MAGHSKWANIKHKKARQDARKGKVFTKLAREISVAAKEGGGDPEANYSLNQAIQKAKSSNMPNENIERAIKKGTGELEGVNYEKIVYEGYGPNGTAVMCIALTDNKNRTAGEVRHTFSNRGGNLGENGCVAWMFDQKGYMAVELEETGQDEEEVLLNAIEAGAEDVKSENGVLEIYTIPETFNEVKEAVEKAGVTLSAAEISMIPQNTVTIEDTDTANKMLNLVDELEDHDDVQEVFANYEIAKEILEKLE